MKAPKGSPVRKELAKNTAATIIMFIIGVALCCLNSLLGGFGMVIGGLFILMGFGCIGQVGSIKRSHCPECGMKYNYEDDVEWRVGEVITSDRKQEANVEIACECANCGHVTEFEKKFTVATIDNQGNVKETNLESSIRKFFK